MSVADTGTEAVAKTSCWSCLAETRGGHFCAACGKVQPLGPSDDYFAFFGLPRKLEIGEAELEERFHQLSWKLHPDNFVRASEHERNLALERSSELNDAYRTLRDPIARVEYLLARAGVRQEGAAKQQAPPELLEEVFELNESLEELRGAKQSGGNLSELRARLAAAQKTFQQKLAEVDAELGKSFSEWDRAFDAKADAAQQRALMSRLNEILNRRSYIRNLVRSVAQELLGAGENSWDAR